MSTVAFPHAIFGAWNWYHLHPVYLRLGHLQSLKVKVTIFNWFSHYFTFSPMWPLTMFKIMCLKLTSIVSFLLMCPWNFLCDQIWMHLTLSSALLLSRELHLFFWFFVLELQGLNHANKLIPKKTSSRTAVQLSQNRRDISMWIWLISRDC